MNLFGLKLDHPAFPERVTLTIETWLSWPWAGACWALYTVSYAGFFPRRSPPDNVINICLPLFINAVAAWKTFSPATVRDYRLHYRHDPSASQLLLLELLRLAGFVLTKALLLKHAPKAFTPLLYFISDPPLLLRTLYQVLVTWGLWTIMPEIIVISPSGFTLPKFIARFTGMTFEVYQQVRREAMAAVVIRPRSNDRAIRQAEYHYSPILTPRTIRLLRLETAQGKVSCRLQTMKLDEAPEYWALSYLWGSEEKPMALEIIDFDDRTLRFVPITKNCAAAIKALMPMGVRYLWIDAICISQEDIEEKQHQIPLMGEIYSKAALVVGHLYTENEFPVSLLVHRMIQKLSTDERFDMKSATTHFIFRALGYILVHPYFERAWIVQEMVLARDLMLLYGKDCIWFDHLLVIAHGQAEDRILPGIPIVQDGASRTQQLILEEWVTFIMSIASFRGRATVIEELRKRIAQKCEPHGLTVAQIVDQNMSLGAKNPRDQVYALLSLASDSNVPELRPNYSPLVSNKELFTKISWHYLHKGHRLNLFLSAGSASRMAQQNERLERTPGLPSWVYDFAIGPNREFRLGNWTADVERNRPVYLTCRISPDMEELSVHGSFLDQVAHTGPQPVPPATQLPFFASLANIVPKWNSSFEATRELAQKYVPQEYPGGITREEAHWRTMLMDCLSGQTPAPPEAEAILAEVEELIPIILANPQPAKGKSKALKGWSRERAKEAIDSIMLTITRVWAPYTFVVTKSGYMGWAPPGVQAGDVFCLFDGCIVPFVLRPTHGADTFVLWGDGYIHGFLPRQRPGIEGMPQQWFKLV